MHTLNFRFGLEDETYSVELVDVLSKLVRDAIDQSLDSSVVVLTEIETVYFEDKIVRTLHYKVQFPKEIVRVESNGQDH